MDARQVREAVTLVNAVVQRIRELRRRRIGSWTTKRLLEELEAVNRGIAAQDDKGFLLAQKTSWFNHDNLLNELGNVQAIMQTLQGVVSDAGVRQEIERSGNSLDKTLRHLEQGQDWVKRFRADVIAHEQLLQQGLSGERISASALDSIENRLVRFHDWEDKVVQLGESAVARITQSEQYHYIERQPMSYVRQVAASLVLAIASTVFSAFATPAYAQEEPTKPVAAAKADELTDQNIADLLKHETVEKVLDETDIIKGAKITYVKYDKDKKTSDFADILSKVKQDGAIVMLYLNGEKQEISQRAAILAKLVSSKYNLPVIAYNHTLPSTKGDFEPIGRIKGIIMTPSLFLASKYDLVKGETKDNNDGKMKIIDTIRGGPDGLPGFRKWYKNATKYWVPTNLTEPNNKFVWRSENSENAQWVKMEYNK